MSREFICVLILLLAFAGLAHADANLDARVARLESQVQEQQNRAGSAMFLVLILFGAFCALWAQNTGRSSWLWFFCGVAFNVVTVIVLLINNAADRRWDEFRRERMIREMTRTD
jgi:protein-S-isoprenylcysteine O-methyltransferase Ste14